MTSTNDIETLKREKQKLEKEHNNVRVLMDYKIKVPNLQEKLTRIREKLSNINRLMQELKERENHYESRNLD